MFKLLRFAAIGLLVGATLAIALVTTQANTMVETMIAASAEAEIKRRATARDEPTMAEKQQLVQGATLIGALYFCNANEIYKNEMFNVGWAKYSDIFTPYFEFPGSSMYQGAMYISQLASEAAATGSYVMFDDAGQVTAVTTHDEPSCMQAEAELRNLMLPGKVLDGKWSPSEGSA